MALSSQIIDLDTLKEYLNKNNNSVNNFYMSDIPEVCKEYPSVLGIDEAGRGPVLGPMVYGIAFCPVNELTLLGELGCDDSKALTEQKRDLIFTQIGKLPKKLGWGVEIISPNTICNNMLSRTKYSLNQISMDAAVKLIKSTAEAGVNIAHVYVDTVGKPEKYQAYLNTIFPKYKITVAKKADSTYPIVSMASICAKVIRDHALKFWHFREGHDLTQTDFGSGYPGDPITKQFLLNNSDLVFGYPQLVRFSWSTAEEALKTAYFVEWDNAEEESANSEKTTTITSFFKISSKNGINEKCQFFKKRCLSRTTEL